MSDFQKEFDDKEDCFGKHQDLRESACQRCKVKDTCKLWELAGGNPLRGDDTTSMPQKDTKMIDNDVIVEQVAPEPEEVVMAPPVKPEKVKGQKAKAETLKTASKAAKGATKGKDKPKAEKPAKREPKTPKVRDPNAPPRKQRDFGERDADGFTLNSVGGKIFALLKEGTHTRKGIEAKLNMVGKSSVSVYLMLFQKPVGSAAGARGITLVKNAENGHLSIKA